ncbi:MAG TPA: hypothetical protein VF715_19685 [Thermoleophilaceae bacterium]
MLLRWPQETGLLDKDEEGNLEAHGFEWGLSQPEHSVLPSDHQFPTKQMTTDIFPAEHARSIEGTLLVAAATTADNEGASLAAITAAESMRDALPLPALAILETGKAFHALGETGDVKAAAEQLERAGDSGADHLSLWNSCLTLWTYAEADDLADGSERVRVGLKALRLAPDDFFANASTGFGYMALERPVDAIPYLERALSKPPPVNPELTLRALTAAYRAVGRIDEAQGIALGFYQALPRRVRKAVLRQLGVSEAEFFLDPFGWQAEEASSSA